MARDLDALAGELPIAAILPAVLEAVRERDVVIEAPPGAGKTTVVPLALLEHGELGDGEILVLQPRRLAARLSAVRVAQLCGEEVGGRVGYRVRFDAAGSARTRLWFLTEGVLLRRLRDDPELAGVDAVILDEFHERHLDGDLALALLRRLQARRPLRLIVMSATLDAEPVADFLDAVRLGTEGRSYAVEIEYRSPRSRGGELPLERRVAAAVRELIDRGSIGDPRRPGHALVFLPGAREIAAAARECASLAERAGLELLSLHGQLPREQQDRAVGRGEPRRSKLILSTNVAETSITIDGVVAVVDSGLARVPDFDPETGLPRLSLTAISRASAAQRAGRAGRTRAGICVRLYGRHDHDHRPEHQLAEIRRLDLAGAVLELAAAGVASPEEFPWFEAPPLASLAAARTLLGQLGAIDEAGALTAVGRAMLRFPLHPRLARLLLAGVERGVGELAAMAAAVLAERPPRTSGPTRTTDADVLDELELLERGRGDPTSLAAVRRAAEQLRKLVRGLDGGARPSTRAARELALRQALLAAHPDRVATVRVDDHGRRTLVFAFGGSAELAEDSGVRAASWVIALRSEDRREGTRRRAIVRSACAIDPEWLIDQFPEALVDEDTLRFDPARARVVGESSLRYGKLTIASTPLSRLPDHASTILLEAARASGARRFCGKDGAEALAQLCQRSSFVHGHRPELPILDDARIDEVLAAACVGKTSFAELDQANLLALLELELGAVGLLDRLAPRSVTLPGGRKLAIHYEVDRPPWVGSWLQDFFGMRAGPRVLDGAVPIVLHLRAPNRHDVAVTTDLAAFWREHYPELRKRLSRRYPRHDWPEDPLSATPPAPGGRRRR